MLCQRCVTPCFACALDGFGLPSQNVSFQRFANALMPRALLRPCDSMLCFCRCQARLCLCFTPRSNALAELVRPMPLLCCAAPSELGPCLSFRCCSVLVITMPTLNNAKPVPNFTSLRQCFARPFVASAPIVAVAGDCSTVPTHCSPMPMPCCGFRPCRASLRHCLAEHNFATATLSRTSLCLGYAVHVCATTELCFAIAIPFEALPTLCNSKHCLRPSYRGVPMPTLCHSKLRCATARPYSGLPCPRCAIP